MWSPKFSKEEKKGLKRNNEEIKLYVPRTFWLNVNNVTDRWMRLYLPQHDVLAWPRLWPACSGRPGCLRIAPLASYIDPQSRPGQGRAGQGRKGQVGRCVGPSEIMIIKDLSLCVPSLESGSIPIPVRLGWGWLTDVACTVRKIHDKSTIIINCKLFSQSQHSRELLHLPRPSYL